MDVKGLIAAGERAFAVGKLDEAQALLEAAVAAADGELLAEARNDLAVVHTVSGDTAEAQTLLYATLAQAPSFSAAMINLAEVCERSDDLVQASHWWRSAVRSDPQNLEAAGRLSDVLARRARPVTGPASGEVGGPCAADMSGRRVLIAVEWFHPSVGGSERLAEAAGQALQRLGATVEVVTHTLETRAEHEHGGMPIHELDAYADDGPARFGALVERGRYDAVLAFSGPEWWPVRYSLAIPQTGPRVVVVPCVNAHNYARLNETPVKVSAYRDALRRADQICVSSYAGFDRRLADELGVEFEYLPNAVDVIAPTAGDFRSRHGLPAEQPLLLMVGNFWPEKNHLGLLDQLGGRMADAHLVLVGAASRQFPELAEEVNRRVADDSHVSVLGGLPPEEVSAAIGASAMLLLPSVAEATPLVLLEAMSHGVPWVATPTCGAAHDHAGGLILRLEQFMDGINFLMRKPAAEVKLGGAGRSHWESSYNWSIIGPRYGALLAGEDPGPLLAPAQAMADTEAVRASFFDELPRLQVDAGSSLTRGRQADLGPDLSGQLS